MSPTGETPAAEPTERIAVLESAIRWALGEEGEFAEEPDRQQAEIDRLRGERDKPLDVQRCLAALNEMVASAPLPTLCGECSPQGAPKCVICQQGDWMCEAARLMEHAAVILRCYVLPVVSAESSLSALREALTDILGHWHYPRVLSDVDPTGIRPCPMKTTPKTQDVLRWHALLASPTPEDR